MAEPGPSRPSPDPVEIAGPWQHRHVAANGARFHVAESGPRDGPLVLLLHGFPEFWWAWRAQLPALGSVGFRTVAMDLRGYGGSDKTPNGYDPVTLAQDASGVVKALGARSAAVVGHGWGGYVAWATAVLHPREVSALCAVSAPHPNVLLRTLLRANAAHALPHLLSVQVPWLPERRLADPDSGYLRAHLRSWSGPGGRFPDEQAIAAYQRAISLWPASHCALEYHRWLVRSRLRTDGRRFRALMRSPVRQPVLTIDGADDPAIPPAGAARSRYVVGEPTELVLPGVGHFPHEEDPDAFTDGLLSWLAGPGSEVP